MPLDEDQKRQLIAKLSKEAGIINQQELRLKEARITKSILAKQATLIKQSDKADRKEISEKAAVRPKRAEGQEHHKE